MLTKEELDRESRALWASIATSAVSTGNCRQTSSAVTWADAITDAYIKRFEKQLYSDNPGAVSNSNPLDHPVTRLMVEKLGYTINNRGNFSATNMRFLKMVNNSNLSKFLLENLAKKLYEERLVERACYHDGVFFSDVGTGNDTKYQITPGNYSGRIKVEYENKILSIMFLVE